MPDASDSQATVPAVPTPSIGPHTLTTLGVFVGGLLLIGSLMNIWGAQTERMKTLERDISETRSEVREARAEVRQIREILLEEFRDSKTQRERP